MTSFKMKQQPAPSASRYGIGRMTGNLYLRISGHPQDGNCDCVLLAPGPRNTEDQYVGHVAKQAGHQIDWLPEGSKMEIEV